MRQPWNISRCKKLPLCPIIARLHQDRLWASHTFPRFVTEFQSFMWWKVACLHSRVQRCRTANVWPRLHVPTHCEHLAQATLNTENRWTRQKQHRRTHTDFLTTDTYTNLMTTLTTWIRTSEKNESNLSLWRINSAPVWFSRFWNLKPNY